MQNSIFNPFAESPVVIERIAETQGEIFLCANNAGYDMEAFTKAYLQSDFCKYEMDAIYSPYQLDFGSVGFEILQREFEEKGILIPLTEEEGYESPAWIGQMYRYLFYELETLSNSLYSMIFYQQLAEYSVDCEELSEEEAIAFVVEKIKRKQVQTL